MPYMNLGYFSPRICMVMMISSSEPFSKWLQCNLASSPLTSGDFAISLANIKGEHIIYAFGVIFCKEFNGGVVIVCCATYEIQVCTPNSEPCKSFGSTIPASVHLKLWCLPCSQSGSMSSSNHLLQVSPHHVVTCVRLVFSFCCTYPCVNFTDTTPSPESLFTFMLLKFW